MSLHDPDDDLQYEAALDRLTREKAGAMLAAAKAGLPNSTKELLEHVCEWVCDDNALLDLIEKTLQGKNAFMELLKALSLEIAEEQAKKELENADEQLRESRAENLADMAEFDRMLSRWAA